MCAARARHERAHVDGRSGRTQARADRGEGGGHRALERAVGRVGSRPELVGELHREAQLAHQRDQGAVARRGAGGPEHRTGGGVELSRRRHEGCARVGGRFREHRRERVGDVGRGPARDGALAGRPQHQRRDPGDGHAEHPAEDAARDLAVESGHHRREHVAEDDRHAARREVAAETADQHGDETRPPP